ncbi:MAG TPA: MarR family transcriptional regulator [Acidimicrobiales bacterium]|nr:MarR family transcriptional regulator [Acidimicrobiales bacterium]
MASVTPVAGDPDIECIGLALESVGRLLSQGRLVEQILRQAKVDAGRADVALLHNLSSAGDCVRLGELADRLRVDAPTVTRRVQQLGGRQLLRRVPDPRDKRASLVHLTPAGARLVQRVLCARRTWLERVLDRWSERDRAEFGRLLARFVTDVGKDLEGPDGH